MASAIRDKAFISYSRDDKKWLDLLLQFLKPWMRAEPDKIWWDGRIQAGQEWRKEIQEALATAKVAVMLVSPGFLASEFILDEELPRILDRAKSGGVTILWDLVRNCAYESTLLRGYQSLRYQETHTMKAWNVLSEAELDDCLVHVSKEIVARLRSDLAPPAAAEEAADMNHAAAESAMKVDAPGTDAGPRAAKILLKGVENPEIVAEIGDLFVLRRRWSDARFTYNRMIELAAPYKEIWMAWGYEKLGLIHRKEEKWKPAGECWKLAQVLYRRTGKVKKAAEMERLLQDVPAGRPQPGSLTPSPPPPPPK